METIDHLETNKGLPTFLKVLCILSYIGIGIGLIGGLINIVNHKNELAKLESQIEQLETIGFSYDLYEKTVKYGQLLNIIGLITNVGCLLGVIWMWKLKRKGFYVYTLFELTPVFLTLIFYGSSFGAFGPIIFMLSFLFPVAFVIMYATNLKHMS
jgi:hypothetical protein